MKKDYINLDIQTRIINYFARLDGIKPSEFSGNYIKEWHYLCVLKDLVLKDIESNVENGGDHFTDVGEKVTQSGLLDD